MRPLLLAPLVALLLCAGAAHAKEADDKNARLHFQTGEKYYRDREFAKALAEFSAGHALTDLPAFLLNIAQCHRQLGHTIEARDHYRRFVAADPTSPHAAEAQRLADEYDAEIRAAQPPPPPPVVAPAPVAPPPPTAPPTEPPRARSRWWLWTALVVLVAGAGAGIAVAVVTLSTPKFMPTLPDFQALSDGALLRF